jgi:hypothetical protein
MEIRWKRIFGFLALMMLTVGALKLHKSGDTARYKWHSMVDRLSGEFQGDPVTTILYIILFFEITIVILWVISRVVNWFRR